MHFRPGSLRLTPPRIVVLLLIMSAGLHPAIARSQTPPPATSTPPPATPATSAPPDSGTVTSEEEATEEEGPNDGLKGKGSLGISIGAMKYVTGNELSSGSIRPILRGSFKYVWNSHIVTVVESGWGWNAYGEGGSYSGPDSVGTLATVIPITVGLDYRFYTSDLRFVPRVGGGVGFYILGIRAGRDQISRDPVSDEKRESASLGFYGKGGFEYMMKPTFALNVDLLFHQVFSAEADKYPRGWLDDNTSFLEARVGISHYFTIRGGGAAPKGGEEEETTE